MSRRSSTYPTSDSPCTDDAIGMGEDMEKSQLTSSSAAFTELVRFGDPHAPEQQAWIAIHWNGKSKPPRSAESYA